MKTHHIHSLPDDWLPTADVFFALGDTTRQRILLLFEAGEELSIKEIVEIFPLSRTAIVHHLHTLEKAGIVSVRKKGKAALYSIETTPVLNALDNLRDYIKETFA